MLTDVKQRLGRARFAEEFTAADWNYGTNLAYLRSSSATGATSTTGARTSGG